MWDLADLTPLLPKYASRFEKNRKGMLIGEGAGVVVLESLESAVKRNATIYAEIMGYGLSCDGYHITIPHPDGIGVISAMNMQYVNHTYGRTGALWDGRYKSSLIQAGTYLLVCQRYIELNPVRAGMVSDPGDYRWSSYRANALG